MLDNFIAYHCGPALAGIKPANIVSCQKSRIPEIHAELDTMNQQLNPKDIYLEILCECEKRVLVMVYRRKVLTAQLHRPEMQTFLRSYGYPENTTLTTYLSVLKERLQEDEFPHEIGVFLGYPLHDIHGFIHHPSEGCLLTGEWKVYQDAEGAEKLFVRYKACRNALLRRITKGLTLAQIFCAA